MWIILLGFCAQHESVRNSSSVTLMNEGAYSAWKINGLSWLKSPWWIYYFTGKVVAWDRFEPWNWWENHLHPCKSTQQLPFVWFLIKGPSSITIRPPTYSCLCWDARRQRLLFQRMKSSIVPYQNSKNVQKHPAGPETVLVKIEFYQNMFVLP